MHDFGIVEVFLNMKQGNTKKGKNDKLHHIKIEKVCSVNYSMKRLESLNIFI